MIRELLRGVCRTSLLVLVLAGQADAEAPPARSSAYTPRWTRKLEHARIVRSLLATEDGGYALLADERDFAPVLRRFDAAGVELWNLPLGELACRDGRPHVYDAAYTPDIGFTLTGTVERGTSLSYEGVDDVWVIRVDPRGQRVWQKLIGSRRGDEHASALAVAPDGKLAIAYAHHLSFVTELGPDGTHHWTAQVGARATWGSTLSYGPDGRLYYAASDSEDRRTIGGHVFDAQGRGESLPDAATEKWYTARFTSFAPAVQLHVVGPTGEQLVTLPSAGGPSHAEQLVAPPQTSDRAQVGASTLFLTSAGGGKAPTELIERTAGTLTTHPLQMPSEVTDAPCRDPGTCERKTWARLRGTLADGSLLMSVTVEAAPPKEPGKFSDPVGISYEFLVAFRAE